MRKTVSAPFPHRGFQRFCRFPYQRFPHKPAQFRRQCRRVPRGGIFTRRDVIFQPQNLAPAVPENLKKYESNPAHAFLAAEAAWLNEEYEANGVTSAEQLVAFCRK